jgi:hypothetical protein
MSKNPSSTSSAKDDSEIMDLNELALAQYADCLGLTDREYEELKAMCRPKPKLGAAGLTAIAFIAVSVGAIVIAITNWGWK